MPRSGFWKEIEDEFLDFDLANELEQKHRAAPVTVPKKHWATPEEKKILVEQKDKMLEKGLYIKTTKDKLKTKPSVIFPAHQKGSVRSCVDQRGLNGGCLPTEKMRLLGGRASAEIYHKFLSPFRGYKPPSHFQTKRDVSADIASERMFARNFSEDMKTMNTEPPERAENVDSDWDGDDDSDFAFLGKSASGDKRKGYFNFGVKCPQDNAVAVPVGEDKKTGNTIWEFFFSVVTLFGALASVTCCVWMSECVQAITVNACRICASVYIDDAHIVDRPKCLKYSEFFFDLTNDLIGFLKSPEKDESHDLQEIITQLGLSYRRKFDRLLVEVPEKKRDECIEDLETLKDEIAEEAVDPNRIERIRGKFRYCVGNNSRIAAGIARGLDPFVDQFYFNIMQKQRRLHLDILCDICIDFLKKMQPLCTSRGIIKTEQAHIYSDASGEDLASYTYKQGIARHNVVIGAILVTKTNNPVFFSLKIEKIPKWMKPTITVFEAMIADLALLKFEEMVKQYYLVHHVDNAADCYGLIKGSTEDLSTQPIITNILKRLALVDLVPYFAWIRISTLRNIGDHTSRLDKLSLIKANFPNAIEIEVSASEIPWANYKKEFLKMESFGRENAKRRKTEPEKNHKPKN